MFHVFTQLIQELQAQQMLSMFDMFALIKLVKHALILMSCDVFQFYLFHNIHVSHFLHACEKLNHDEKFILKKCQKLSVCLAELNAKVLCLKHHQHFLKKCDDKLIQESMKIFKKELHVLKKKQNSVIFSDDNS